MAILKQSTAYTRMFLMVDSADHVTGKTGLTVTVTLSKAGAAFAAAGGAVTEVSSGWYKLSLNTTDTNTLGDLAYHCTSTGADPTDFVDQVSAALIDDVASYVDTEVAAIKAKTDNLPASPAAAGDAMTLTVGERDSVADALLDRTAGVETSRTPRQAFRLMLAALAGKASGLGTTTAVYRDTNDSKNRISATVDADGNRSSVTLDAS